MSLLARSHCEISLLSLLVLRVPYSEMQDTREFINDISMPDGAKIFKAVMKDVVSDVLFYAESVHRDKILSSVAHQINDFHMQFAQMYPDSAENVHIIAHSLGSVVAFDLLCSHFSRSMPSILSPTLSSEIPQLTCAPKNLFVCGSPLGLFLSIRGGARSIAAAASTPSAASFKTLISPSTGCLGTTRCRNVIHPLDVLAYRLVRVPLLPICVLCVVLFVCEMCVFVCVVLSCVELCVHSSREPAVLSLGFSLTCDFNML
jgi:hypothetical protein